MFLDFRWLIKFNGTMEDGLATLGLSEPGRV